VCYVCPAELLFTAVITLLSYTSLVQALSDQGAYNQACVELVGLHYMRLIHARRQYMYVVHEVYVKSAAYITCCLHRNTAHCLPTSFPQRSQTSAPVNTLVTNMMIATLLLEAGIQPTTLPGRAISNT
jgi:hypothetical protein